MSIRILILTTAFLTISVTTITPQVSQANGSSQRKENLKTAEKLQLVELREEQLRARSRDHVLVEVTKRARELGVQATESRVGILTDLLADKAWLEIRLKKCTLTTPGHAKCSERSRELDNTEALFRKLTNLSTDEFKSGRRLNEIPKQLSEAHKLLPPAGSQRTDPNYCVCDVSIASQDRWINRYWGLECNNHAGHGFCSNDLDWAHSPGAGAMTGTLSAFLGNDFRSFRCPDDHETCFKGPMDGSWGNVCNCDNLHSQFTNPQGAWFGGDLTHNQLIWQTSFPNMVADGPCSQNGIIVTEFIKENDPWCCDDPMGTLFAPANLTDGTTTIDVATSVENCNGGSQSGAPPYCGTFGATIRISTTCQTGADEIFGSCEGRCGELLPDATCNCDFECQAAGDCCYDYCDRCAQGGDGTPFPCDANNEFALFGKAAN